jgi:F5/8 type C domain
MDRLEASPSEPPGTGAAPERPPPSEDELRLMAYRSVVRWTLGLLLAIAAAIALVLVVPRAGPQDLARGRPWRASSMLAECHPERITCGNGRTAIFFHTRDEFQPWVELDLGEPTRFSEVAVYNRRDGDQFVLDRAVPLILEVGDDQATWRVLARQGSPFSLWRPRFEPTTARYVRLRSPRTTMLHLHAVEVYR